MPASPEDMAASMIANMKSKTGKTLEQWLAVAKKTGAEKHGAIVKALKADHGLTHGYANLVAHKVLKSDAGSKANGPGRCAIRRTQGGPQANLRCRYQGGPITRQGRRSRPEEDLRQPAP